MSYKISLQEKWVAYEVKWCFAQWDLVFLIEKIRDFLNKWQHLLCDGAWILEWTHQQGRRHAHCVFDAVVTEALLVGTTGTPPPPPPPNPPRRWRKKTSETANFTDALFFMIPRIYRRFRLRVFRSKQLTVHVFAQSPIPKIPIMR